jgi:hypothetical protein
MAVAMIGPMPGMAAKRWLIALVLCQARGKSPLDPVRRAQAADDAGFRVNARAAGVFINESTLEVEIGQTPKLSSALLAILDADKCGPVILPWPRHGQNRLPRIAVFS